MRTFPHKTYYIQNTDTMQWVRTVRADNLPPLYCADKEKALKVTGRTAVFMLCRVISRLTGSIHVSVEARRTIH